MGSLISRRSVSMSLKEMPMVLCWPWVHVAALQPASLAGSFTGQVRCELSLTAEQGFAHCKQVAGMEV
jgi:hypothetical protein